MLNSASARVETFDYDADLDATPNEAPTNHLHRHTLTGWTLDADGAQVAFADVTEYAYDSAGRVTQVKGPFADPPADPYVGPLTAIEYEATSGSRSAVKRYPAGAASTPLTWTFSEFDAQGNPQTVTDPNGRATAFTYDTLGRVLTAKPPCEVDSCTGADDTTVSFTYDVDGNLTRIDFPNDTSSGAVFLTLGYDPAKPSQLRFLADSQGNAIVYTHEKGRVVREERYTGFASLASPGTRVGDAEFDYDAAGRLVKAFNPLFGSGTVFSAFDHDPKGNPTVVTDENGKTDTLAYDALDRLVEIAQVRAATYETEFAYDALSNVIAVTDATDKTTDLLHDDRGNLVETLSPDTGRTRFVNDAAGNLVTKIENAPATGTEGARITHYAYDGLNRLLSINLPNDPDWLFTYDTDAAQNQKGRLASVTNGVVTTELAYTRRGDVASERTEIDGFLYFVHHQYDAAGNRVRIETPSGNAAETKYAGLRPRDVSITGGSRTEWIRDLTWHPFGPRTGALLPPRNASNANTVTSERTVNLRGQITEIDVFRTGAAFVDRSYRYAETAGGSLPNDPGPNLDQLEDHLDASESRSYFYDELDRLARATTLAGTTTLHEYAYDAVGNRTSKLGPLGASTYTYEANTSRLAAATGAEARDYAHDAFGNRTWDHPTAYADTPSLVYDDANRLVEVLDPADGFASLATYTYDAFGRRVKKQVGTAVVLFFYDTEGHLVEDVQKIDGAADVSRTYVFVEDELVALIDKVKEVGTAAWVAPGGRAIEVEPHLLFGATILLAGLGAGLATRRAPVGIATTTSGAALLLLCAGTPQQPRMAFVHTDPLGTPIAVTNAPTNPSNLAKVVWRASHEPFGKATVNEDPDGDTVAFSLAVRFPGQYEDAETGWHYNFYRTYDPSTGRYLEADPIGQVGGINVYLYGDDDPINRIDPTGLTYLEFDRASRRLYVDPERSGSPKYSIPATSGRDDCMNVPKCEKEPDRGPIPGGQYLLNASQLRRQSGWRALSQLGRGLGDYGSFFAPLTPYPGNPTQRHSFYLHGGWFPGSAGCVDVGGGPFGSQTTDQLITDILSDPDGVIPLFVR